MAFIPSSGSVAAWLQSDNASVITVGSGSVFAIVQNLQGASVSGTVGASIIGNVPVVVQSSIAAVIIGGSIATSFTPPANQSVSGTVQAQIQGSVATVIIGGSIAASFTPPANQSVSGAVSISNFPTTQNVSGSVVAFQGTSPFIITGSVQGSFSASNSSVQVLNFPTTQNISGSVVTFQGGTVITSITGTPAVSVQGTVFVSGSVVTVGTPAANQSVSGTVGASILGNVNTTITSVATAGGFLNVNLVGGSILTSSTANQSISGTVQTDVRGSVATVIIGGSISATFTPPANQSVSGVVMAQGLNAPNASVTGNPVVVGGLDANGSVQGAKIVTVVSVAGGLAWLGITSVSGTVQAQVQSSIAAVIIGGSIATATTNSSVMLLNGANVIGSVTALQGTNPWVVNFQNSSIIAINAGSVVTLSQGSVISLIQGSVAAVQSGTRITSVSGVIFQNAPTASWVSGVGSLFTGVYQPITGSVSGQFTYVTGVQVVNASANNVYISFSGAGVGSTIGSIIGYTVAPANGGSNVYYPNALKTGSGSPFQASVSGVASIFVSAQGFTSNT